LSTHLLLCLPSGFFPSGFPPISYMHSSWSRRRLHYCEKHRSSYFKQSANWLVKGTNVGVLITLKRGMQYEVGGIYALSHS
jgi:hypothetical protein